MSAVHTLGSLIRSVIDPAAREWLTQQDQIPGGPKRLSRGIEPPATEAADPAPATAQAVVAS